MFPSWCVLDWFSEIYPASSWLSAFIFAASGLGKCPKHHPTIGDISSPTDICFGDVQIPQKGTFTGFQGFCFAGYIHAEFPFLIRCFDHGKCCFLQSPVYNLVPTNSGSSWRITRRLHTCCEIVLGISTEYQLNHDHYVKKTPYNPKKKHVYIHHLSSPKKHVVAVRLNPKRASHQLLQAGSWSTMWTSGSPCSSSSTAAWSVPCGESSGRVGRWVLSQLKQRWTATATWITWAVFFLLAHWMGHLNDCTAVPFNMMT